MKTNDEHDSEASASDGESTNDVVLSLRDPAYLRVMHQYFKKLGSRSNPNPDFTESDATKEVFDMFKKKDGKFLKLSNPRNYEGGFYEVDDEDALDSEYIL